MNLLKLRRKAHKLGMIILVVNDKYVVTNMGLKYPVEKTCNNLEEVEKYLTKINLELV